MKTFIAFFLAMGLSLVCGGNLTAIELRVKDGSARASFTFSPDSAPIPKFFQSYDKRTEWYYIYFLETISSITLGAFHAGSSEAPFPQAVLEAAERQKQGSIRNFLKVGFKIPHSTNGKFPAKKAGPGILVLELGPYAGPDRTWVIDAITPLRKVEPEALPENKKGPEDRSGNPPEADAPSETFTLQEDEDVVYEITKDQVNVREGPGVDFPSMGKASKNQRVAYVHREGNWLVVNWGSKTGFIREDMLTKVKSDAEPPQPQDKARIKMERDQETQLKELQEDQRAQLAVVKKELRDLKEENRTRQEEQIEAMRREFEEKLAKERAKNKKLLEDLKESHDKSLEQLREENQFALKKVKKSTEKEREEIEKAYQKEVNNIESTFKQQQQRILKEHDQTLETMQEKHKREKDRRIRTLQKQVMAHNNQPTGLSGLAAGKKAAYDSYGTRDPFLPVRFGNSGENLVTVDQMKLVGIIWHAERPIAVLEHRADADVSVALQEGDRVDRGRVMEITKESAIFEISEYGVPRTFVLKLASLEGGG